MKDEWNECNFVGDIHIYRFNEKYVNNYDDYDERLRGESQWKNEE